MPIDPTTAQSWLFVPPLDLPLTLRVENGRFGALRRAPLAEPPPCATGQVIPADDPFNPTGAEVHYVNQLHEAVDLAASAGDCVFAAYSGRVVELETNPAGTKGNVTIDHHPQGLGFVTKYNHVTDVLVAEGAFIQKGMPFAAVSAEPAEPHLHFELWAVVDRDTADASWPGDSDLVPVDPTRTLYAWEQRTAADEEPAGGPLAPQSIGLVRLNTVPFFSAAFATGTLYVPMYEPMTADERLAIDLLRDAYRSTVNATLRYRSSSFWGVDVITQVQLVD
ncbi:MAG: M23 family metallopeptidase [Pseudomonadota bacterium]|nr:M23 family metallopeptidase [Gammaproteobacteria bacterium]MDQ3582469.1 M23 family metallopeptidase [Pseudomonadota bacterium]